MITKERIAEFIENNLSYTNGWKISDEEYSKICLSIGEWIVGQIEPLVMQTAGNVKPPLGVIPKIIWMEQIITELNRDLFEYISISKYDDTTYQWLIELYSLYRQRDK